MTPQKTKEAFDAIYQRIARPGTGDRRLPDSDLRRLALSLPNADLTCHLRYMCVEGKSLVDQGRTEKAMRWLGFLQGAMWGLNAASIEEMKEMNRPVGS